MAGENPQKKMKNMPAKRTASALIISILGLALIIIGGWVYTIGLAVILALATWEYTRMFIHGGYAPAQIIVTAGAAACAVAGSLPEHFWLTAVFTVSISMAIIYHVFTFPAHSQTGGIDFAISLSALAFIGFLGSFLVRIRFLPDGLFWIIIAIAPAGISDIAAYIIGSRFGNHQLVPELSPGKSAEGFIAGIIAGTLSGIAAAWISSAVGANITWKQGLITGIIVGTTCPLGDLAKSLVKRQFGLKNTGSIIPGHGGVLDRIDTWLWAGPAVYFLILIFL